jgi:hypothetical protein
VRSRRRLDAVLKKDRELKNFVGALWGQTGAKSIEEH